MFDETGCDGLLIAKGDLGSPWIFKYIETYLKTPENQLPALSSKDILEIMQKHIGLYKRHKNVITCRLDYLNRLGNLSAWYLKRAPWQYRTHIAYNMLRAFF